jgi:hypothetical protein
VLGTSLNVIVQGVLVGDGASVEVGDGVFEGSVVFVWVGDGGGAVSVAESAEVGVPVGLAVAVEGDAVGVEVGQPPSTYRWLSVDPPPTA